MSRTSYCLGVQWRISQILWSKWWLVIEQATSPYQNQWWHSSLAQCDKLSTMPAPLWQKKKMVPDLPATWKQFLRKRSRCLKDSPSLNAAPGSFTCIFITHLDKYSNGGISHSKYSDSSRNITHDVKIKIKHINTSVKQLSVLLCYIIQKHQSILFSSFTIFLHFYINILPSQNDPLVIWTTI